MAAPEPRLGPLVHRSVHHGAAVWLLGALQFIVAMVVVQLAWTGHPGYSLTQNYISDLGNTACGPWSHATTADVCSPWHDVFNASVIALGLLVLLGVLLVRTGFPLRRTSAVGLGLLVLAGLGAIGIGFTPENVNWPVHELLSLVTFVGANLGLVVLSLAMFRDTRWSGYRAYTLFSGLIGLVATLLLVRGIYAGLGAGGMERLVVAPVVLWFVVVSAHLLRIPQFAPRALPT